MKFVPGMLANYTFILDIYVLPGFNHSVPKIYGFVYILAEDGCWSIFNSRYMARNVVAECSGKKLAPSRLD